LEYTRLGNTWLDWRIMVCTLLRATEFTRTWGIRLLRIPSPSTEMATSGAPRANPPSTAEDGAPQSLDSLQTVSLPQESQQATSNGQHLTNGKHLNGHTPAAKKSAAKLSDADGDGESVPSSHSVAPVR
jgi:hypothetical protein